MPYKFRFLGNKYLIYKGAPLKTPGKLDLNAAQLAQLESAYYETMKVCLTLHHQVVESAALPDLGTGQYAIRGDVSAHALINAYNGIKQENKSTFPGVFRFIVHFWIQMLRVS